jgi:hypothetical protein
MTPNRGDLREVLLGFLSRHCRGAAACRKAWRLSEDLRALGLDVDAQAVLDAATDLRRQGYPVVATNGDMPTVYLEESRPDRARANWRGCRRPRPSTCPVSRTGLRRAADRALASAEAVYGRRPKATSSERNEEPCHAA